MTSNGCAQVEDRARRHDLADALKRWPRHPGTRRLRPFADVPSRPTRSDLEDDFLAFAQRFGLPRPQTNVHVHGCEVDAFFPARRVIVELDSYAWHQDRAAFERDRDRDAAMLAEHLPTVGVTWERMLSKAEREAARLHRILGTRPA